MSGLTMTLNPLRTLRRRRTAGRRHEGRYSAEFGAIVDTAMRFIAAPPALSETFVRYPHRKASDAMLTGERGALSQHVIYGLARTLGFRDYLEVGTRFGYSIGAVLAGSRRVDRAVTIDPFVDHDHTRANLATLGRDDVSVEYVNHPSREFDTDKKFDAVYVDGDHTYEVARDDMVQYWAYVRPGGLMLIDDTINERIDARVRRDLIGVRWAAEDFVKSVKDVAGVVLDLPTYSGFGIIQKRG